MGQQKRHPDRSGDVHTTVHTPTGDARMDADQQIKDRKEPDERQAGHQQAVNPSGKQQGKPAARQ